MGRAAPNGAKIFHKYGKNRRQGRRPVAAGNKKGGIAAERSRGAAKGFKFVGWKLLLRCAASRFAEPRNSLKKVLIVAVRSCGCGVLIQGLENLEASLQRGRFYILFASCKKNQKARQRFANLWTPGTIQIAGRYMVIVKMTGNHQVTGYAKSCNFAGYRRQ